MNTEAVALEIESDCRVSREARTAIRNCREDGTLAQAGVWFRMASYAVDGATADKYIAAANA